MAGTHDVAEAVATSEGGIAYIDNRCSVATRSLTILDRRLRRAYVAPCTGDERQAWSLQPLLGGVAWIGASLRASSMIGVRIGHGSPRWLARTRRSVPSIAIAEHWLSWGRGNRLPYIAIGPRGSSACQPKLVILHGGPQQAMTTGETGPLYYDRTLALAETLASHGVEVIIPNYPGSAMSGFVSGTAAEQLAEAGEGIAALLRRYRRRRGGTAEPAILAMSHGGLVLEAALSHGAWPSGVILVGAQVASGPEPSRSSGLDTNTDPRPSGNWPVSIVHALNDAKASYSATARLRIGIMAAGRLARETTLAGASHYFTRIDDWRIIYANVAALIVKSRQCR